MKNSKKFRTLMFFSLLSGCGGDGNDDAVAETFGVYYSWMSAEIQEAWASGFYGQGTQLIIVDAFRESRADQPFFGNLGDGEKSQLHGEWISDQVAMLAPRASQSLQDFSNSQAVTLEDGKLNIINLSYGILGDATKEVNLSGNIIWSQREQSIIDYAANNLALVVKSAGNDGVAINSVNSNGEIDYLNQDLIGARSAIFVGALESNGSVDKPVTIASYSNYAGNDAVVQDQFLLVGVPGDLTGLHGTSFAAPVVTGYAAVLGSKFTTDSPEDIKNRLLQTARTDTIAGYQRNIHGQGEASLARALAPDSIQ